jgi:hypothetical protein
VKTKGIGTSAVVAIIVVVAIAGIGGGYFVLKSGEETRGEQGDGGEGAGDVTPPTITGVWATETENSVTITWTTNEPSDSVVNYGTTQFLGSTKSSSIKVSNHTIIITELESDTEYYYEILSTDEAGNTSRYPEDPGYISYFTTEAALEFELKSWEVVGDDSYAKLELVCYSPVSVSLYLSDPNLNQIATDYISDTAMEDGSETSLLRLASYKETPIAGIYNLVVKSSYPAQTLYTKGFSFSGADVNATNCAITDWTYWVYSGYYSLEELSVDVRNDGDLPAYAYKILIDIDGEEDYAYVSEPCILPGQSKTITKSFYMSGILSGTHTVNLTLVDADDNIQATCSTTWTSPI